MDEVEPEAAEEQLTQQARLRPALLARVLSDLAGLLLGNL
jgi:hypothetical protein